MASKKATKSSHRSSSKSAPFGAGAIDTPNSKGTDAARAPKRAAKNKSSKTTKKKKVTARRTGTAKAGEPETPEVEKTLAGSGKKASKNKKATGSGASSSNGTLDKAVPKPRSRVRKRSEEEVGEASTLEEKPRERTRGRRAPEESSAGAPTFDETDPPRDRKEPLQQGPRPGVQSDSQPSQQGGERRSARAEKRRRWQERRRQKRRQRREGGGAQQAPAAVQRQGRVRQKSTRQNDRGRSGAEHRGRESERREVEGLLVLEQANHGHLRERSRGYLPSKEDVHVPPRLVQKLSLRDGALIKGSVRRGQGRNKWDLQDVETVDGKKPEEVINLPAFKGLTSIDPDFHYAVGDGSEEVSLMVVDLLCPVGRGQRGLIVAPPRSGKTILLQQFAKAVEKIYPEVHLMVLLVDERPEEATEWTRSLEKGEVFVSTNDEMAKKHVELCEVVWRRCKRMVELGEDVILLLDSITRMGRAYNNVKGNSGKTMSGGIDSRALERPKQFFGAARNTETAGSLTILATALIETGSQMDRVIFEEFKGTGNMELVLSRKLSDRRIFPSIDIEKTGTRKEERLHSKLRLHRVNVLRRVLMRMHWAEAMELLVTKLDDVEKIDDFLSRFDVDPED